MPSQMAYYEVELLVGSAVLARKAPGNGFLVECVPYTNAVQRRQTAHMSFGRKLIYRAGIGNKTGAVAVFVSYLVGYEAAQVAGMLVLGIACVGQHLLVDGIDAALYRLGQPSTAHDGIEMKRHAVAFYLFDNKIFAECILVDEVAEAAKLLACVRDVAYKDGLLVGINGYFGRRRARVDD